MYYKKIFHQLVTVVVIFLSGCAVGPDYVKPIAPVPVQYKEIPKNWKLAQPQELTNRGPWWVIFHDAELNRLEKRVDAWNQSVVSAAGAYLQARAIVDESRAAFFPTFSATASVTRQRTGITPGTAATSANSPANSHELMGAALWTPDIWGSVRRTVEASAAGAQSSAAALAAIRLASEGSLAQFYFQLRALDNDQKILNDTVKADKAILKYIGNRYRAGIAGEADYLQAKTQLETAEASALNNGILRGQYEHAIAVLVGVPPANFIIVAQAPYKLSPPAIPIEIPSVLLERRPDVAQQERLVAQANAQIGIAISAYFPVITLSATGNVTNPGFANWFSIPALSWALGLQAAETIFDGGLRSATIRAARANLTAVAATYKQTVLTAFQNVEDNLVSLRILNTQAAVSDQAARDAHAALRIVLNEYKAGTVDYTTVLTAQTTTFAADKTASDVHGQQMTSAAGLVQALGGGWDVRSIANAASANVDQYMTTISKQTQK